jgi:hypothetical protein
VEDGISNISERILKYLHQIVVLDSIGVKIVARNLTEWRERTRLKQNCK